MWFPLGLETSGNKYPLGSDTVFNISGVEVVDIIYYAEKILDVAGRLLLMSQFNQFVVGYRPTARRCALLRMQKMIFLDKTGSDSSVDIGRWEL